MFRAVWLSFWGDLNTPESYYDEPGKAAANQGAHWALGLALASLVCLIYFRLFGEMPHREAVWAAVVTGYLFLELRRQEWQGADTINDTMFVGLGAAFALVSLKEIWVGGQRCLDPRADEGLLLMAATLVIFAAHLTPRAWRQWRGARQQ